MTKQGIAACVTVALMVLAPLAHGQDLKIGVVNSDRILRDSTPARAAMQKLEAEFSKRDKELQDMGARLKTSAERFEKDGPVMTETDRARRQRELAETDREFQRKQREFREDFNQRRNEELQLLPGGAPVSFGYWRDGHQRFFVVLLCEFCSWWTLCLTALCSMSSL